MEDKCDKIPSEIAKLIVGYFHRTLTPHEHDMLDEWLCLSDDHIKIFEDCLEITLRPVRPETNWDMDEEEREMRYIAELLVKHVKQTITEKERKTLNEWASASPHNKKFLEEMPQTNDLEKAYHWLMEKLNKEQNQAYLN